MTAIEKTPKTVRVTFPEVDIMKIKRTLKKGEKLSEVLLKKYIEHNALQDSIARYEKDKKDFEEINRSLVTQINEWVAKCVESEKREKILQEQTNKLQVENNQLKEKYSEIAPSYDTLMNENKSLTEKARKASDAFLSECARHDNTQIELRKAQSEVNRLKNEREKMSQQIATLQADIFAKETFWGKIKNLFA